MHDIPNCNQPQSRKYRLTSQNKQQSLRNGKRQFVRVIFDNRENGEGNRGKTYEKDAVESNHHVCFLCVEEPCEGGAGELGGEEPFRSCEGGVGSQVG